MKQFFISRFFSLTLALSLLLAPLPLSAMTNSMISSISEAEIHIINEDPDNTYISLESNSSDIGKIISYIIDLDNNKNSILTELQEYIENGGLIAQYDAVVEALEYAESVLQNSYNTVDHDQFNSFIADFELLVNKILYGELNINPELPNDEPTAENDGMTTRVFCPNPLIVSQGLDVLCKTTLRKHLNTKQGAHIQGRLKVGKRAKFQDRVSFKDNVSIEGFLSAEDAELDSVSVNDLVVVNCMNSLCVDTLSVNDIVITGGSCLDDLCITNLSAVDVFISGTASINDAFITNATIENLIVTATVLDQVINNLTVAVSLSVNDAVIQNLQVTNMSVVDQTVTGTLSANNAIVNNLTSTNFSSTDAVIQNLQVTNISVADQTVTGTLSANNAIVNNLTSTSLSSTDAVIQNLTVTNCMANLCVNTISIVDQAISGTLSVNNAIVNNLTSTDLSSTDAVIQNLTVTNCMTNLCVNTISIVDQTISGTLSVNNAIVTNLTSTSLSSTDAVIQNLTATNGIINGTLTLPALTPAGVVHNNGSGLLSSSLIVDADITNATISNAKLATISSANTAGNIVVRDGSGNFATNMITLNGTVTNPTDAATKAYVDAASSAVTGANVGAGTGLIFRDKTGNDINFKSLIQGSHIVITNNANDITLATDAVSANTANTIVARGATGNFSAGAISVTDEVISSSLTITPFGTAGIVHNNASGLLSSSLIVNADVAAGAAIVDTKLATIATAGKVSNSATTATSANTANAIVARSASGGFSAGVVSVTDAVLSGDLFLTTAGTVIKNGNLFIHNTGTNNLFVGVNAGNLSTSGTGQNSGIGVGALTVVSTGIQNTALGYFSLLANTTGSTNTALGANAMVFNTTGRDNTAVGGGALGANTIGIQNTAIGTLSITVNTTGSNNTALGYNGLRVNTGGSDNVALGVSALGFVTTGNNNIGIGTLAGGTLDTGSNNIYIGDAAVAAVANESNTTRIAGIFGANAIGGSAVFVTNTHQLGTVTSSQRFKHNIEDMNEKSANIFKLRPVTFAYNNDETENRQYGLIAEEVDRVFPDIVLVDNEGIPYTVQYHVLPVLLLNEMQKQQVELLNHKALITKLEALSATFAERLDALEVH